MKLLLILVLMTLSNLCAITLEEEHIVAQQWLPCFARAAALLTHAQTANTGTTHFDHQGEHIADINHQTQTVTTYYQENQVRKSISVPCDELRRIITTYQTQHNSHYIPPPSNARCARKGCCLCFFM